MWQDMKEFGSLEESISMVGYDCDVEEDDFHADSQVRSSLSGFSEVDLPWTARVVAHLTSQRNKVQLF